VKGIDTQLFAGNIVLFQLGGLLESEKTAVSKIIISQETCHIYFVRFSSEGRESRRR